MFKKNLLSFFAVIIAVAAVAFKNPPAAHSPMFASHTFYYQAPSGSYAQADVQNKANWISNPGSTPDCETGSKACQMDVDDAYTEVVGGVRVFKTSGSVAVISATGSGSSYAPVAGSTSVGITARLNRP